jgi:hypothetical protein
MFVCPQNSYIRKHTCVWRWNFQGSSEGELDHGGGALNLRINVTIKDTRVYALPKHTIHTEEEAI